MLKIESLQKFKNSDKKEGGSADAKPSVLQLDCTGLMVYLHKLVTVQLRCVRMCTHMCTLRKTIKEKKENFLINAANIATSYFICHFY